MSNKYAWGINQLDWYPRDDKKIVFNIHWRRQASNEEGNLVEIYGTQEINFDTEKSFTPYNELTEKQVIEWLETAIGDEMLASYTANLDERLTNQLTPTVVSSEPPWA